MCAQPQPVTIAARRGDDVSEENESIGPLGERYYTEDFFSYNEELSRQSASVMVPLILELVHARSVIDVGCGTGEWLSVFWENGIEDIWGIDGPYVNPNQLKIPRERFIPTNLEQPFRMDRKYELVVSLEVAEHLSRRSAHTFVGSLTELGPVVLFSAAIPHQGGVNHANEQWPEYWAKLFNRQGYIVIDALRKRVWSEEKVQWWYAQNTLLFVAREQLRDYPLLSKEYEMYNTASPLSIVHPKLFLEALEKAKLRNVVRMRSRIIVIRTLKFLLPRSIYELLCAGYRWCMGKHS
jgi:SAM-dependent methyltransferase